eukprot:750017-Hanusia_phi.AAC.2
MGTRTGGGVQVRWESGDGGREGEESGGLVNESIKSDYSESRNSRLGTPAGEFYYKIEMSADHMSGVTDNNLISRYNFSFDHILTIGS